MYGPQRGFEIVYKQTMRAGFKTSNFIHLHNFKPLSYSYMSTHVGPQRGFEIVYKPSTDCGKENHAL